MKLSYKSSEIATKFEYFTSQTIVDLGNTAWQFERY
jgi:hypothetical protein